MNKFNSKKYTEKIEPVYAYIEKFWKKNKHDLATSEFDLEECFTLLESQYSEAKDEGDIERTRELFDIQFRLKIYLTEVLTSFEAIETHSAMMALGQILYNEKPIIITFNYDCFLEASIENASHLNQSEKPPIRRLHDKTEITVEELAYSTWKWNRPLGYSIKFNEVMIHDGDIRNHLRRKYVSEKKFYSYPNHDLYSWYILKLHGSTNWFRYIPQDSFPKMLGEPKRVLSNEEGSHIIIGEGDWSWRDYPELNDWPIDPIIIAPLLHKEEQFRDPVYSKLLPLWKKAKAALSLCKRLIIIGYSFPATDFLTKKMFLEAFSENTLKELIVVNPDDDAIKRSKNMCHFNISPEKYQNLDAFVKGYEAHLDWNT